MKRGWRAGRRLRRRLGIPWRVFKTTALIILAAAALPGELPAQSPADGDSQTVISAESPAKRVVSVLYFEDLRGEDEFAWLSKGIADSLISELASVEGLAVVERERLQEIIEEQNLSLTGLTDEKNAVELGKILNAGSLVSGSYAVLGGEARVSCRVTDVETARIEGSTSITVAVDSLPRVHEELAAYVCGTLNLPYRRRGAEGTIQPGLSGLAQDDAVPSLSAMRFYYRGLELYDRKDFQKASEYLEKALEEDPSYVKPRRTLESCYSFLKDFRRARQMREIKELTELLEAFRRRLAAPAFLSYGELVRRMSAAGASPERIRAFAEKNPALLRGNTPAEVLWNMQITMHDIARRSLDYFDDESTAAAMYARIVSIAGTAEKRLSHDPFLPEILYQELLVYYLRQDWDKVRLLAEKLMIGWPDFRMAYGVEDFYERALEELSTQ